MKEDEQLMFVLMFCIIILLLVPLCMGITWLVGELAPNLPQSEVDDIGMAITILVVAVVVLVVHFIVDG